MLKKENKTAVITGGASGIGAAFAENFASSGWDLLLVDRNQEMLQSKAEDLAKNFHSTVDSIVADLSNPIEIEAVANTISQIGNIEMLVNCAGFGTHNSFLEVDSSTQLNMIQVHVSAAVRLCHAALKNMKKLDRGAIINMGSINAFTRFPNTSIYAAAKMFMVAFTESLETEFQGTSLKFQTLCPGNTHTAFCESPEMRGYEKSRIPLFLWMTAPEVVEKSLHRLSKGSGTYVVGWKNKLYISVFGSRFVRPILNYLRSFGLLEQILTMIKPLLSAVRSENKKAN